MSDTDRKSKVEVLPGTYSPNSGPHPVRHHADEVELMKPETMQEAWEGGAEKMEDVRPVARGLEDDHDYDDN